MPDVQRAVRRSAAVRRTALVPVRPHDAASDWFAFAVMAFRSLLGVGPWGGVHQPATRGRCPPRARCAGSACSRADVVYPRAARPLAILPDELADGVPRDLRARSARRVPARRCSSGCACAAARRAARSTAACAARRARPSAHAAARGRARPAALARRSRRRRRARRCARSTRADARSGSTAARCGARRASAPSGSATCSPARRARGSAAKLGVGFYRAGGYAVGFVFRPDRGVLDDRVALPKLRGQLVAAHATIGDDRAWLWLTCADAAASSPRAS